MKKFYTKTNDIVIALKGEDKEKFLQNIITNDLNLLKENNSLYSLLLNNKGRYLVDFFLVRYKNLILLISNKINKQNLLNLLDNYKVSNKIDIFDVSDDCHSYILTGNINLPLLDMNKDIGASIEYCDGKLFRDPRHKLLPIRVVLDAKLGKIYLEKAGFEENNEYDYETIRLKIGIPEAGYDLVYEKSLPHEFCLGDLNAISYSKGCYIGQELVARSKYIGVLRKHIMQVIAAKPISESEEKEIYSINKDGNKQVIGKLSSYKNKLGLAIIRQEEYNNDIQGGCYFILNDGNIVQIMNPGWIK